jgi:hypothetical protein
MTAERKEHMSGLRVYKKPEGRTGRVGGPGLEDLSRGRASEDRASADESGADGGGEESHGKAGSDYDCPESERGWSAVSDSETLKGKAREDAGANYGNEHKAVPGRRGR